VPNVDLISQDICKDDFGNISRPKSGPIKVELNTLTFSSDIHPNYRLQAAVSQGSGERIDGTRQTLELLANISHFLVDTLLLQLANPRASDVRNEL
jgi:hypothetical protein